MIPEPDFVQAKIATPSVPGTANPVNLTKPGILAERSELQASALPLSDWPFHS
jgi:hypothetical protein